MGKIGVFVVTALLLAAYGQPVWSRGPRERGGVTLPR